jgi:YesN/AraC family two-component response regulator
LLRDGIAALVATQKDMEPLGEASSGREAVELFRTQHPDITLMDLQMPEMSVMDAMGADSQGVPEGTNLVPTTYRGDFALTPGPKCGIVEL